MAGGPVGFEFSHLSNAVTTIGSRTYSAAAQSKDLAGGQASDVGRFLTRRSSLSIVVFSRRSCPTQRILRSSASAIRLFNSPSPVLQFAAAQSFQRRMERFRSQGFVLIHEGCRHHPPVGIGQLQRHGVFPLVRRLHQGVNQPFGRQSLVQTFRDQGQSAPGAEDRTRDLRPLPARDPLVTGTSAHTRKARQGANRSVRPQ